MLEGEGLVEALPGGGFAARALTLAEIHDAIELRGALEGTAARFAAERLESVEELSEMQAVVERLDVTIRESAGSIVAYVELNEAFHDHLVGLAKSDPVTRAVARLRALPFASPGALVPALTHLPAWRESLVVAQHQHRSLLEAIATRQGAWAEEVAREHARLSRHNLDLLLAGREGLETLPGAPLVEVVLRAEA